MTRRKTPAAYPEQHERAAARRYLEHSHTAATMRGGPARVANEHAVAIDEEHPRARDIALTGTARELGPLPPHLRRHQREERDRARITTEQAAAIRREYRAGPYHEPDETHPEREPAHPRRERARQVAGGAARHASAAASAAADTSAGELVSDFFLWGAALSVGYLLLTRAAAVGKLFEGATSVARAVISPVVDPLNPRGAL